MDRTVSYTFPNDFVDDSYTFTIPAGNTYEVKFYLGGDTAPGSNDTGYGVMLTSPVRSVISLNTISEIMFGFREVVGSKAFDGATSQHYYDPYVILQSGADLGFAATASNHDAGLYAQWNLGSTPGVQTATLQQFVTPQGTNLNAVLGASSAAINTPVPLDFSIVNTELVAVNGLDFTATLPAGLVVVAGAQSNTCGGTVTATIGASSVALSGGTIAATTNCVISVPVSAGTAGTYAISSASVSGLANLSNNVGTSSFNVSSGSDNDGDGIPNTVEDAAPNNGDGNNDGTDDKDQLNVASFVNPISGQYSTLVANNVCDLTSTSSIAESTTTADTGYSYPLGLISFTADCGTPGYTTTITQYYFNPPAGNFVVRKFVNGTYLTISGATITPATIGGVPALVVSYQVTDGGALDDDGLANGIIVDPAGLAVLGTSNSAAVGAPKTGYAKAASSLGYALLGLLTLGLCAYTRRYAKR